MYYQCTYCYKIIHKPLEPIWLCECGKPLSVHYDWEGISRDIEVDSKDESLWRYASILPSKSTKEKISLGEGWTPLLHIEDHVYIKMKPQTQRGLLKIEAWLSL